MILALLARLPFADGLLLHDHSDHGIHSHTVTLDDLHEDGLCAAWQRNHDDTHDHDHDDDRDDRNNDSDGDEYADSLLIFVSDPAVVTGIYGSSGAVIASIQHPSSRILPRSMLPGDPTDSPPYLAAPWPSAHPMRPAFALDALLQSSQALLL